MAASLTLNSPEYADSSKQVVSDETLHQSPVAPFGRQDGAANVSSVSDGDAWTQPPLIPVESESLPADSARSMASQSGQDSKYSVGWDPGADISTFDAFTSRSHGLADPDQPLPNHRSWEEQKAWEQAERQRREWEAAAAAERAQREERERHAEEEWHRGEEEALRAAEAAKARAPAASLEDGDEQPLPLGFPPTPQETEEHGKSESSRPQLSLSTEKGGSSTMPQVDTPRTKRRKQTSETYQIKHINWADGPSNRARRTPILVQNANGPCPLLALVNALTLSTPADETTALVETLRVREQVSLGLLLDAVFDELMSGRRGDAAQDLPDVGELYTFLVTLHTGMNVNPRFLPGNNDPPNLMDDSPTVVQAAALLARKVGCFEQTREMRLYSTFSVPLIHGWLPNWDDPAYDALERSAKSYEDAQNLLFREEELDDKLRREGLSDKEQQLLQDIALIKHFLAQTATQLTPSGLERIGREMPGGSIAILFRNDHFSTLYKHPRSDQLLQVVTDMGYVGHEEVVWESLVDVSGERTEFFAGDLRPVGNNTRSGAAQGCQDEDEENGWTTVGHGSRRGRGGHGKNAIEPDASSGFGGDGAAPGSPAVEQEDHDLALALQLQEEEEDRHRREMAARRREESLSQEFLSQQSGTEPSISPRSSSNNRGRRSGRQRNQEVRPLVPPQQTSRRGGRGGAGRSDGSDEAPPSYEQAASGPAYFPPPEHPAHAGPPPPSQNISAYGQNSGGYGPSPMTHPGFGASSPPRRGQAHRAHSMRVQAGRLVDEVTGPAGIGPGMRRRQSSGMEDEYGKKDCVVM